MNEYITPVKNLEEVILKLVPYISKSVIITDVSSVKLPLIKLMNRPAHKNIRFVGGHPIAGSEYFGPSAAQENIFSQKRLILTPTKDSDHEDVTVDQIIETMHKNTKNVKLLITETLKNLNRLSSWNWKDKTYTCLDEAIITKKKNISKKILKELKPLLRRRFSL